MSAAVSPSFHAPVKLKHNIGSICENICLLMVQEFIFLTSSINSSEGISTRWEHPVRPATICKITTPKLNTSNFDVIIWLSMYSGGMYPLQDNMKEN
jgi:hypothetical protein